jgi:hypothetical protein
MKKLYLFVVVLSAFAASSALAEDYKHLVTHDGVEVMVQYDPLGPNNAIVADVEFVNKNPYSVDVNWKWVITCEGENKREGPTVSFSMDEGGTHVVDIWRLEACGQGRIKDFGVEMDVKKAGP